MKRRLRYFLVPCLMLVILGLGFWLFLCHQFANSYRTATNRETAALIGSILEAAPELDYGELIQILRDNSFSDTEAVELGDAVLEQYGYFPTDYASPHAENVAVRICLAGGIIIAVLTAVLMVYFILLDYRREHRIGKLISYLQDLNQHIYDLRLNENSEDELSLLTNELYKITVSLKEAAELNQKHRQNLETALADISHQLRTPLTSLKIMVDNIYDDPDMSPAVRQDFLRSINHQIDSMSELVTTLLHLAQFDNGSIKLCPQPVSARAFLAPVLESLAVLADLSDIDLELSGALDTELDLDVRWQREALANIIKNCIEHTPNGGKVRIAVDACPLFVRIDISDEGEGIKKSDLKRIFQRFYRVPGSQNSGVGIGLAFAKTVVEAASGQITVHSTPEKGTKFSVTYFS